MHEHCWSDTNHFHKMLSLVNHSACHTKFATHNGTHNFHILYSRVFGQCNVNICEKTGHQTVLGWLILVIALVCTAHGLEDSVTSPYWHISTELELELENCLFDKKKIQTWHNITQSTWQYVFLLGDPYKGTECTSWSRVTCVICRHGCHFWLFLTHG